MHLSLTDGHEIKLFEGVLAINHHEWVRRRSQVFGFLFTRTLSKMSKVQFTTSIWGWEVVLNFNLVPNVLEIKASHMRGIICLVTSKKNELS